MQTIAYVFVCECVCVYGCVAYKLNVTQKLSWKMQSSSVKLFKCTNQFS